MEIKIAIHQGSNDINFGLTRESVRTILGKPFHSEEASVFEFEDIKIDIPAKDNYFENEVQIHYNDNLQVEYIEFHAKESEHLEVFLGDINIFKTPARELINSIQLKFKTDYDHKNEELPFSYIFKSIDLALWQQEIADTEEDNYFCTIGVGRKGYFF